MKKKPAFFLLLLVVLLLTAGMWYFRPQSFDNTLSRFDPDKPVTACYAILIASKDAGSHQVEFPVDSDAYQEIMATLRSTTYRRGAGDLLRLGRAAQSAHHPGALLRPLLSAPGGGAV